MKTKSKFLKIITLSMLFLVSTTIIAQTSTSPTQLVCIGSTEPYLLNPSNPTSNYQWVLNSGGTIITGQGSDAITIDWNMVAGGPHTLTVTETDANGCAGYSLCSAQDIIDYKVSGAAMIDFDGMALGYVDNGASGLEAGDCSGWTNNSSGASDRVSALYTAASQVLNFVPLPCNATVKPVMCCSFD